MFLKTVGLVAAFILASAVPAFAESMCSEPIAPAAVDGNTATNAQMTAAGADVKTFIKQSDDYQDCLWGEFKVAVDAAKKAKKDVDPTLQPAVEAKIKANQTLKEKVGAEYNASALAYKAKHPGE